MEVYHENGVPLCESPEWGMVHTRCEHIAVSMVFGGFKCMWYDEKLEETGTGWVARCDKCAVGMYKPRGDVSGKPRKKTKKKVRPWDISILVELRRADTSKKDKIVYLLSNTKRPVSKSELIARMSSIYWGGVIHSGFILAEKQLKKAFEELVAEGVIEYTPRKPLILNKKSIT